MDLFGQHRFDQASDYGKVVFATKDQMVSKNVFKQLPFV